MRRTTTIDLVRPDGPAGPALFVDLHGRDRRLDAVGEAVDETEVALRLALDPASGAITALEGGPADQVGGLDVLVGAVVRSGFGRRLSELLGNELARRTLRASLLEDLPGALLVSGYSPLRAGALTVEPAGARQFAAHQADICIGWATGGAMHTLLAEHAQVAVPLGPDAPELDGGGGWHRSPDLVEGTVRRRRRLDVAPAADGSGGLVIDSHLRDSYRAVAGGEVEEMVLHEYVVGAVVDRVGHLSSITVDPRVLPWAACPGGAASASQLVGTRLVDVATRARTELVGPTTCTHLTSTLRALADVGALA